VRLVDPDGGQIGLKSIEEARWLADQLGLDLVEVAPDARPPVVRMMDYGKYKYEQSVRAREARKKQTRTVIKEVQFRPKISTNDFDVKRKRVERFLGEGDKVKVTMRFRGREVTHPELGRDILDRLVSNIGELGTVETFPRMDGRQMTMVLAPVRRPRGSQAHPEAEADEGDLLDAAPAPELAGEGLAGDEPAVAGTGDVGSGTQDVIPTEPVEPEPVQPDPVEPVEPEPVQPEPEPARPEPEPVQPEPEPAREPELLEEPAPKPVEG
jgi:translation initiation factor IF-3